MSDAISSMLSSPPGQAHAGTVKVAAFDKPSVYVPQARAGYTSETDPILAGEASRGFVAQPKGGSPQMSPVVMVKETDEQKKKMTGGSPVTPSLPSPIKDEPLVLTYEFRGTCETCHVHVTTTVVKVRGESFALALCPLCKEVKAERKVKPL